MSETVQPLVDVLFPYIGYLIPLPIIIPAVAAALALIFCRIPNAQRQIVFFSLLIPRWLMPFPSSLRILRASKRCR